MTSPGVGCRALPHSPGPTSLRTFPQLNLHKARVRRNHGRLPSHGFIERAPEHRARVNFFLKSAPPDKALIWNDPSTTSNCFLFSSFFFLGGSADRGRDGFRDG
jgi:hypothetical protein